jgi:hypothetical protein
MENEKKETEFKDTPFVTECISAKVGDVIKRDTLTFDELFNLMYPANYLKDMRLRFTFSHFEITAVTKKDFEMSVWNGKHEPSVEANSKKHICKAGTKVRVWMVSRFGDCGITDNLVNPKGYDCRGVECEDLTDWEFNRHTHYPEKRKEN